MSSLPGLDLLSLADLPAALQPFVDPDDKVARRRIAYQPLWRKACEGTIPATKIGGRWFVQRSFVPAIAEALDRKPEPMAKPARARRAPSNAAVAA